MAAAAPAPVTNEEVKEEEKEQALSFTSSFASSFSSSCPPPHPGTIHTYPRDMHTYPTTTPSTKSPVFEYNHNEEKTKEKATLDAARSEERLES